MKKKIAALFAMFAVMLAMVVGCASAPPQQAEEEVDREIDISLDAYEMVGAVLSVKENDGSGNIVDGEYGGIGILAAEGETIGSALDHAGYSDLQPVLDGDVFEGWMEVVEEIVLDEFDFEDTIRKVLPEKLYTTKELLALTVPDHAVTYVAKWESVPAESYFEPVDAWETDDVTTSGSFSFSANGGTMKFLNPDGTEYEWTEYGYWLEDGQALNEIMGTESVDSLIGIEKEGAKFLGWTLYQADSIFLNEELVEEEGILCFPYESIYYSGYTLLKNPVLVGEQMPTEQLCAMSVTGTNYFALAEWSKQNTESAETHTDPSEPQDTTDSQNADFYSVCTSFSKAEVEQFAREIKDLILASNWTALSERIAYPITMGGIAYEDSASFVAAPFETLLDTDAIQAIQNESCTDMFCKYSGIMMGNGEVWIGEVLNEDGSSAGLWVISLSI